MLIDSEFMINLSLHSEHTSGGDRDNVERICEELDLNLTFAPKGELVPHQGIDVILDEGAFGWEPSLYILAHNPLELVDRMHRIISLL